MKTVAVIGGKLQGMEAAYLGKAAGYNMVLIDINPAAPAQNLFSEFVCGDVTGDSEMIRAVLDRADMLLPAMENMEVLEHLVKISRERGYILAFDMDAYRISSSKYTSDMMFAKQGIPCPLYYPKGSVPYIAKPVSDSGSHGVRRLETAEEAADFHRKNKGGYIIQEFVEGPSYSVEVIGHPGAYRTYEPTEIFVDDGYDCCLADARRKLTDSQRRQLSDTAVKIAENINLTGIMDLEVIESGGEMYVLEIDARLPSQTPITVYHASGINYIEELFMLFCERDRWDKGIQAAPKVGYASFTQFLVSNGEMARLGEHIMTEGGLLDYTYGLCSETEVISDMASGENAWRGTFINHGASEEELDKKEKLMLEELEKSVKGRR